MSNQGSSQNPVEILAPIDWGLTFAWSHKRLLLTLAALPIFIELVTAYMVFSTPLPQNQFFLVKVCSEGANAWLITVVAMACFERIKGMPIRTVDILRRAFRNLPKVFFSYVLFISLVSISLLLLPILFFVLFFVWAPYFCVGEFYSRVQDKKKDDEYEEPYDPEYDEPRPVVQSSFTNKSIWELGFTRSLQFSQKNLSATFQMNVLFWFGMFVPPAVVDLMSTGHTGFFILTVKIVLSSVVGIFILAAAVSAFSLMLSSTAKEEIGITGYPTLGQMGVTRKPFRIQDRYSLFGILVAMSLIGTFSVLNQLKNEQLMPETAQVEFEKFERTTNTGQVTIRITDTEDNFRWLVPSLIHLELGQEQAATTALSTSPSMEVSTVAGPSIGGAEHSLNKSSGNRESQVAAKKKDTVSTPSLIAPTRYAVLGSDGVELPRERFAPYYEPLKVVLYYNLPDELPEQGGFSLKYVIPYSEHKTIVRGSYGLNW